MLFFLRKGERSGYIGSRFRGAVVIDLSRTAVENGCWNAAFESGMEIQEGRWKEKLQNIHHNTELVYLVICSAVPSWDPKLTNTLVSEMSDFETTNSPTEVKEAAGTWG